MIKMEDFSRPVLHIAPDGKRSYIPTKTVHMVAPLKRPEPPKPTLPPVYAPPPHKPAPYFAPRYTPPAPPKYTPPPAPKVTTPALKPSTPPAATVVKPLPPPPAPAPVVKPTPLLRELFPDMFPTVTKPQAPNVVATTFKPVQTVSAAVMAGGSAITTQAPAAATTMQGVIDKAKAFVQEHGKRIAIAGAVIAAVVMAVKWYKGRSRTRR